MGFYFFIERDDILVTATVKTTKTKAIGVISIVLAAVIGVILFCFGGKGGDEIEEAVSRHVTDNDSRRSFMESMGWETEDEPESVSEIFIPDEFDEILEKYNEIQIQSGFDLSPYLGKTVKKYVYKVMNYGDEDEIYAALYVYNDTVIAADISSYKDSWQRSIDETEN